jgi:hypothetical protein
MTMILTVRDPHSLQVEVQHPRMLVNVVRNVFFAKSVIHLVAELTDISQGMYVPAYWYKIEISKDDRLATHERHTLSPVR